MPRSGESRQQKRGTRINRTVAGERTRVDAKHEQRAVGSQSEHERAQPIGPIRTVVGRWWAGLPRRRPLDEQTCRPAGGDEDAIEDEHRRCSQVLGYERACSIPRHATDSLANADAAGDDALAIRKPGEARSVYREVKCGRRNSAYDERCKDQGLAQLRQARRWTGQRHTAPSTRTPEDNQRARDDRRPPRWHPLQH